MHNHPRHRPPWWPENEPFPPKEWPKEWPKNLQGMRHRYLWRAMVFFFLFFLVAVSLCTVTTLVALHVSSVVRQPILDPSLPHQGLSAIGVAILRGPLGVLLLLLIAVNFFFGRFGFRRLIRPISELMDAATRIEKGDYSVRVNERGTRAVRNLARTFNAMTTRLESNEAQRRRLMADVTHELRTPLTIIQGNLEGLLDGIYPRDDDHLQGLLDETQVMARLIEDLRTLSLAEAGTLKLQKSVTDVAELIEDACAAFQSQAVRAGVTLKCELPSALPTLDIDAVRIREVLSNLIANALCYTPTGGEICIGAQQVNQAIQITVQDTGKGITPEELPHIFDRFYKSADSRGTGLGLPIAKSLVEAHGGTIVAESEANRGTTIRFLLPN